MSGYVEHSRYNKSRDIELSTTGLYADYYLGSIPNDIRKRSYSSQGETTMSFRTSSSGGKTVPDYIADPYAWFLQNGAKQRIDDYKKKAATYPSADSAEVLKRSELAPVVKNPPHLDNGHAFWNKKQFCWTSATARDYRLVTINTDQEPYTRVVGGPVIATDATVRPFAYTLKGLFPLSDNKYQFGKIPYGDMPDAHYYGQKAIADLAPTRPDISIASLIGEMREGLPSLIGINLLKSRAQAVKRGKSRTLKGAGDEYLNLQFGIAPLMKDIHDVFTALYTATTRLRQYEADSGSGIRRRMNLVTKKEEAHFPKTDLEFQGNLSASGHHSPSHKTTNSHSWETSIWRPESSTVTQYYKEKIWFSGSFTYFMPLGHRFDDKISKYVSYSDKLFNTDITIDVLWQLQPWSWLVDWFFDIQTTISSYERIKDTNLVVNYGYVMSTTEKKQTQHSLTPSHPDSRMRDVTSTVLTVQKNRVRANPYGFSATTPSGLDLRQWSILGALGFSKLL